jgi:hypothetical protein
MTLLNVTEYKCICVSNDHGYVPLVVSTSRTFPNSWFITGFVAKVTPRALLVERELHTLQEHFSSPPVFIWILVALSLVFCMVFCRSLFVPLAIVLSVFDIRILITPFPRLKSECVPIHNRRGVPNRNSYIFGAFAPLFTIINVSYTNVP